MTKNLRSVTLAILLTGLSFSAFAGVRGRLPDAPLSKETRAMLAHNHRQCVAACVADSDRLIGLWEIFGGGSLEDLQREANACMAQC